MNHEEKLVAIKDLLVLNGRIGLIRPEERQYWVTAIYQQQSAAVHSLGKWIERPMMVTALLHRWLQMDDGEGASQMVNYAMYQALGRDACILDFSKASYPFPSDQLQGLRHLLNVSENLSAYTIERDIELWEYIRVVGYGYWLVLHTWQEQGKCKLEAAELTQIKERLENWPPPSDGAVRQAIDIFHVGRRLATCLWEQLSTRNWKPSWMELHQMNVSSPIITLALMMAYVGPGYLESTVAEARQMGVDIPAAPSLPIQIPWDQENSSVRHPINVSPNEEAGAILAAHFPGSYAWFNLEVPHREFSPEDPGIYEFLENEMRSNLQLQQVYSALDITSWPKFLEQTG